MAEKVEAQGGKGGNQWDDGSEYDAVTKVQVGAGGLGIQYVQFSYVKNGQTEEASLHGVKGRVIPADPFVINHPEEHLVSVEGWYNPEGLIQGLKFHSNKKTSDVIGYDDGTPFTLQVQDKKIIGFHGFAGDYVHSLGAYFVPTVTSSTPLTHAIKQEAAGGSGGTSWDDGVHDGVRKVHVGQGQDGVSAINIVYQKGSQEVEGGEHGKQTLLGFETFEVDADDYIVAVQVTHDKIYGQDSEIITSLTFYTFKGKTSSPYGLETEKKVLLKDKNGGKLVGFHGRAGEALHALGAYFATTPTPLTPAIKQEAVGGSGGTSWDDGVHDGVRKVHVGQGQDGVSAINIVYQKGSEEVEGGEHGKKTLLGFETFEVDADDYIVAVQVTHDNIYGQDSEIITSLTFYTFKGITSPPYGLETEKKVLLKGHNGGKLVGFHGRAGEALHALGAYFATTPTPLTPSKKLSAIGGDKGTEWDDGAYDGVKKVYVGQSQDGISVVKFVYDKGAQEVVGDEHGKKTLLGFEEFGLDYPSEYITAVEGTYDTIYGSDSAVITMLRFKTNKQTSDPYGMEAGKTFSLKEEGHKIVGFHGKVGELLHQFGVHVMPIAN